MIMSHARMAWPRAVIFDLDGTLVDSAPDIAEAVNAGFVPLGVKPFEIEAVKGLIGGGATVAVRRAATMLGMTLEPATEAAVLGRFMETYARFSALGRGLYPGAHELLRQLADEGRGLALCTNKADHITRITLEALGIAGYFRAIVAAEEGRPKKPDPDPLLRALAPLGIAPGDAVMVGDSHADIDAARAAGCRSIAVTYGYSPTPAAKLGADAVAGALAEVPSVLGRLRG